MLFKTGNFLVRFALILTLLGGAFGVQDVQASPLGEGNLTTVLVTSSAGIPLAGKPVYAFDGSTYTGYSKPTDANGEAVLTLPAGSYRFRVDVDGTQFWSGTENHCTNCESVAVTVPEPVLVTVQDTDGMPEPGLNVYAFNASTYTGFHGMTDQNGQVSLRLLAGTYRFRADLNGTQFWSGTTNHCEVPGCGTISVTVSKPMAVTILDTGSAPQAGLNVYAFNASTYTGYSKTTNAAGQAVFTLPLGSYRFRADLNGTQFWSGTANHCDIPGCDSAGVTVSKPMTVTVLDTNEAPGAGLNVYAFNGSAYTGYSKTTNASGQAIFTLPLGAYRFRADLNGTQFWSGISNHCTLPGCESAQVTVTLPVAVAIRDGAGLPKAGVNVYAFNGSTYTGYSKVSDANGQAVFTLPLGSYRFRADYSGTQYWSSSTNHCTLPGCLNTSVTVGPPITPTPPPAPTTRVVTTTSDSGAGSLRQAVLESRSGDTITFAPALAGQTIALASDLALTKSLVIDGSGLSPQVTISGENVAHLAVSGASPTVTISDVTIANGYNSGSGGAIYASITADLTVINSTLKNNHAAGSGGAISSYHLTLKNTTVYQNRADTAGGAFAFAGNGQDIEIINSTVTQNHAGARAGAIVLSGTVEADIENSTFARNDALEGSEAWLDGASVLYLYNTIFACMPGNNGCIYTRALAEMHTVNSIIGDGALSDYGLAELAGNGGPTQTMALFSTSPLIDAGEDNVCSDPLVDNLDQRGVARPQGAHCDIGAYEYEETALPTTTTLTTSPNPSEPGQVVSVTATVGSSSGTPAGTLDFSVNDSVVCTSILTNGTAGCNLILNATGTVAATYHPGSSDYQSSSGSVVHEVGLSSTSVTVIDSPDPSVQGSSVAILVSVSNTYGGTTPAGTVTVTTGAGSCDITLSNGQGSCSVTFENAGITTITASYMGDAQHLGGTGISSHEVVAPPPTPVMGCSSIRDTSGPIVISGRTMYVNIRNSNPYPVTISRVFVAWNYNNGHVGANTALSLQKADLNGTTFWAGSLNQPSAILPLSSAPVLTANGPSRITFTFDQLYNRPAGEQVQIQFSTPGCEEYPIILPVGAAPVP